ncbi:N-acyl-D-amino-acid deacylase family protein [Steroidobacter sp.]|uniref:N-acyl-D-amino-acid deacylase family protein n=1 Tax=Steroidobacter sp. TaxID=1978227 RepID=UPI001A5948EB|nr:D-aminoacylase [Steroidobacter sp.]MBL8267495.1 D-aminoacylase [Steroidobacter sp.]
MKQAILSWLCLGLLMTNASAKEQPYDVIIAGGTIYDGTGAAPFKADVGVRKDRIERIGDLAGAKAKSRVDARGLAVSPGFINMLSQSSTTLLEDGRGESDIRQGVTLELLGEGQTMGPLNAAMKDRMRSRVPGFGSDFDWTTQGEFMQVLERRGVSTNIASFVGATSVRVHVVGYDDRRATAAELQQMQALVRQAMEEGALGVTSALGYVPATFANTDELIALSRVAGQYGGMYISHIRDEGDGLVEAVDELITVAREARVPAHIYHLKAFGQPNWPKMERVIAKVEAARSAGLKITADMYPYTAAFTGLDITMPPWVQEGGNDAWIERLKNPDVRRRVIAEMRAPAVGWSNGLVNAGSPENLLILDTTRNQELAKQVAGKTVAAVARERGVSAEDAIIDLVIADASRLRVAYFVMSEENLLRQIRLPWVTFGSDGVSSAAEGEVLKSKTHPRNYGTFARVLSHYVRDKNALSLSDAVHRLSGFPASILSLRERGTLKVGNYADIAVFDPASIADRSTFDDPHRYAVGMKAVLVNGVQVVRDAQHTGAKPGRFVRGAGWRGEGSKQSSVAP